MTEQHVLAHFLLCLLGIGTAPKKYSHTKSPLIFTLTQYWFRFKIHITSFTKTTIREAQQETLLLAKVIKALLINVYSQY